MINSVAYWIFATLVFISELILWVAAGRWAYLLAATGRFAHRGIIFGILATGLVVLLWAFFMAPNADYRLTRTPRAVIVGICCVMLALLLYRTGDHTYAIIMIPVTILSVAGQLWLQHP